LFEIQISFAPVFMPGAGIAPQPFGVVRGGGNYLLPVKTNGKG